MCRIHGLMNHNKIDDTTYGYMLCSFITPESKTDGYKIVEIPATTWVIFPSHTTKDAANGPGKTWSELYQTFYEWLPTSDFTKAESPEFEMYGEKPGHVIFELWIPEIKKS